MIEVIEDNILDDEDINIDYDVFIDRRDRRGNVQELGDLSKTIRTWKVIAGSWKILQLEAQALMCSNIFT